MVKWRKMAAVTTASAMTIQLAACGSEEAAVEEASGSYTTSEVIEEPVVYEEEMADEGLAGIEGSQYMDACMEWDEQEDGSYVCDDEESEYHGQHFFDGLMYATIGAMVASSYYQSKNKVNGTKREENGGGSGGGGGAYRGPSSTSKGTNGVTNGSPADGQTTSPGTSTTTEQNKTGTNKPPNGAANYSSGKSGFSSGGSSRGGSSSS